MITRACNPSALSHLSKAHQILDLVWVPICSIAMAAAVAEVWWNHLLGGSRRERDMAQKLSI